MAGDDLDDCIRHVMAGASHENEAIELDRAGKVSEALAKYAACEKELAASVAAALPAHAEDKPKLEAHRQEILQRMEHLKGLKAGETPSIPVEQQIKSVQLGMQVSSAAQEAAQRAGGVKVVAATAAVGAACSFMILGGAIGTTFAVVGGAGAAAYATSRDDKIGEAARKVGQVTLAGVDKAKAIDEEHHLTEKAATAAKTGVAKAREVDAKYGISDKVSTGAGAAFSKIKAIEEKHQLTDKVAAGVGKGLTRASRVLSKDSDVADSGASGAAS
jgi:hypothetical protein